jgi:hypothetical protein
MKGTQYISIVLTIFFALAVIGCSEQKSSGMKETKVKEIDLSQYKDTKPARTIKMLFIHHSVGGQWLADKGETKDIVPEATIYKSHPNGGGLRALLTENNYQVHEASYKSEIGENTDICHWNSKFRDKMEAILKCDIQDTPYKNEPDKNGIVMFKSCFPNSDVEAEGKEPGNPDSCEKSASNFRATYIKLLDYFKANPNTLFVVVTAPPLAKNVPSRTKEFIKNLIGSENSVKAKGERIRSLNSWLKDPEKGWLAGYEGKNIVVFDYYDILTRHGESNFSMYATRDGSDSHPSSEGNAIAAKELVSFLNRAVNRFNAAP